MIVSGAETKTAAGAPGPALEMGEALPQFVSPPSATAGFRDLASEVRSLGLLEKSPRYYVAKIAVNGLSWAVVWTLVFMLGGSWVQLLVAAGFGFVSAQTGFLAHDAGHRQISRSGRVNDVLGMIHLNLLCGLSFGWWVAKHNRHHSHPNLLGSDPDVMLEALAYTDEQARSKRGIYRFVAKYQAYLFFFLLLLAAWHILVAGTVSLIRGRVSRPLRELALICLHFALFLGALFWVLSPLQVLAFVAVYMGVAGLCLGAVFAPNHKGMPISKEGEEMDWLHRQILTARNIRPHVLTDFVYGGLNYQIEHHLFPTMPRNHLRPARTIVRKFCRRNGISYHEVGVLDSLREVVQELDRVSASIRPKRA